MLTWLKFHHHSTTVSCLTKFCHNSVTMTCLYEFHHNSVTLACCSQGRLGPWNITQAEFLQSIHELRFRGTCLPHTMGCDRGGSESADGREREGGRKGDNWRHIVYVVLRSRRLMCLVPF